MAKLKITATDQPLSQTADNQKLVISAAGGEANTLETVGLGTTLVASPAKNLSALRLRTISPGPNALLTTTPDGDNNVLLDVDTDQLMADLNPQNILELDEAAGSITYVGEAVVGTATSAASWRIYRIDESGDPELIKLYGGGSTAFDQIWDDRASLAYS